MTQNGKIAAINGIAASSESAYVQTSLPIDRTDENSRTLISSTFGAIKSNMDAFWNAIGLNDNVTYNIQQTMANPDLAINFDNRTYYPHTGVGDLNPTNEMGTSRFGCFSICLVG